MKSGFEIENEIENKIENVEHNWKLKLVIFDVILNELVFIISDFLLLNINQHLIEQQLIPLYIQHSLRGRCDQHWEWCRI